MRYHLIALGVVIAAATAVSAQPAYRLHDNGELWVSRAVTCSGNPCVEWHLLDKNPDTREITAGGAPSSVDPLKMPPDVRLYKRHFDGQIWLYTGPPCSGGSCPGWQLLDNSKLTVSIVAAGKHLYQRRSDGEIWRYTNQPCLPDKTCPGWERLDKNAQTAEITAGGIPEQTELYKRHHNGEIWRFTEPGWQQLGNNPNTQELTATVRVRSDGTRVQALYQRDADGRIWHYTNKPCSGASCPGWELIDNNGTISIVAATVELYQLRKDGTILVYTNQPCSPDGSCPGWQILDTNLQTRQIAAGARSLYKRHDNGAIWRYGSPTEGWQLLYDPTTFTIVSTQN